MDTNVYEIVITETTRTTIRVTADSNDAVDDLIDEYKKNGIRYPIEKRESEDISVRLIE